MPVPCPHRAPLLAVPADTPASLKGLENPTSRSFLENRTANMARSTPKAVCGTKNGFKTPERTADNVKSKAVRTPLARLVPLSPSLSRTRTLRLQPAAPRKVVVRKSPRADMRVFQPLFAPAAGASDLHDDGDCRNEHIYATTRYAGQPLRRAIKDKWLSLRERNIHATSLRPCSCGPCTYLLGGRREHLQNRAANGAASSAASGAASGAGLDWGVEEEDP